MNGSKASFLLSGKTEHLTGASKGGNDNHCKRMNGKLVYIGQWKGSEGRLC